MADVGLVVLLYGAAAALVFGLHLGRNRLTLAPCFAAGGILTFLIWAITPSGWWLQVGGLDFEVGWAALVPSVFALVLLVHILDGVRASRALLAVVFGSGILAMLYTLLLQQLAVGRPLPTLFVQSPQMQLALLGALVAMLVTLCLGADHEAVRRRPAVAAAVLLGAGPVFTLLYGLAAWGPGAGLVYARELALESGLAMVPVGVVAASYLSRARRRGLVLPSAGAGALFRPGIGAAGALARPGEVIDAWRTIHELGQLTAELQAEKDRREAEWCASPLAIVDVDAHGHIARMNPAAERLVEGLGVEDATVLDDLVGGSDRLAAAVDRGEPLTVRGRDGTLHIAVQRLSRADGKAAYGTYLLEDVTQRELRRRRQAISARVRGIHETGRAVFHDFTNLLTAIEANVDLLDRLTAADGRDALGAISAAAARGKHLLANLRQGESFARPRLVPTAADRLLREAAAIQRGSAATRDVDLVVEADAPVRVLADEDQIIRVFVNLIGNAVRASPPGARIRLATRADERGMVSFDVVDEGHGMSPPEVARAFEPGYSSKGEGQGGLGLAVSFLIVDAHGGRIDIASEPSVGTRVHVRLPEARAAMPDAAAAGTALVVAEPTAAASIAAALDHGFAEVLEAWSVEEAVDILGDARIDVLVATLDLPSGALAGFDESRRVGRLIVRHHRNAGARVREEWLEPLARTA